MNINEFTVIKSTFLKHMHDRAPGVQNTCNFIQGTTLSKDHWLRCMIIPQKDLTVMVHQLLAVTYKSVSVTLKIHCWI